MVECFLVGEVSQKSLLLKWGGSEGKGGLRSRGFGME